MYLISKVKRSINEETGLVFEGKGRKNDFN
jgi:hypothetical protein